MPTSVSHYSASASTITTSNPDDVGGRSIEYQRMAERWSLIEDLLGGTLRMRQVGRRWLPQEEREKPEHYSIRLQRSILHAGLENAIDTISSKPFAEAVSVRGESNPEWIQEIVDNPDGTGRGITEYANDLFRDGTTYGHSVQWIDAPNTGGTLDPRQELALMPTFSMYSPPSVLGWRSKIQDGEEIITQLRLLSTRCEPDGLYGEKVQEVVTLYQPGTYEVFAREASSSGSMGDWESIEKGTISYPVEFGLPVVPFYVKRMGTLKSDPPFEELAWTNLAHWQSDSDQRNILRFARVGMLVIAGATDEERDKGTDVGPRNVMWSQNPDIKVYFAEHSGAAIGAGQKDLERLEERMRQLGMEPLTVGSVERTAREVSVGESRSLAAVQSWIRREEQALRQAVVVAGRWKGQGFDVPEDFGFDIFSDFVISDRSSEDLKTLNEMNARGKLSDKVLLQETKRRGVLADGVDVEEELDEIEARGPELGLMTGNPFGAPPVIVDPDAPQPPAPPVPGRPRVPLGASR